MAHRLGQADVEVCEQKGAGSSVRPFDGLLLVGDVRAQAAGHALQRSARIGQDARLDDAPRRTRRAHPPPKAPPRTSPKRTSTKLRACSRIRASRTSAWLYAEQIGQAPARPGARRARALREDGSHHLLGDLGLVDAHGRTVACCRSPSPIRRAAWVVMAVEHGMGAFAVDVALPRRHGHGGDAVANEVAQRAGDAHEPVHRQHSTRPIAGMAGMACKVAASTTMAEPGTPCAPLR